MTTMQWKESAVEQPPKDADFWGYLSNSGIHRLRFKSAEENCREDGGTDPSEYIECFVKVYDPSFGEWSPRFWLPLEAIPDVSP